MTDDIDINKMDEKLQEKGWKFVGPVLHYTKAWKEQASIYEKEGNYIVVGIDTTGKAELNVPIEKNEAEKRVKESSKEIRKFMFKAIE